MIEGLSAVSATPGASVASPTAPAPPGDGVSFEQAIGKAIGSAVDTLKAGEAAAIQGVQGAAAPMAVVESVMEAQRALQSALAIRDKVISAWQDISRMSV